MSRVWSFWFWACSWLKIYPNRWWNPLHWGYRASRKSFYERSKTSQSQDFDNRSYIWQKGYVFPSPAEVVDNANKLISEMYSRGKPVILCGYALGKAQIISYLFSSWDPIFVHESVKKMNEICSNLGVPLNSFKSYSQAKKEGLLDKKPWIIISPSSYSKT